MSTVKAALPCLVAMMTLASSCDCGDSGASTAAAAAAAGPVPDSHDREMTGVTGDGTTVIFAGPRSQSRVQGAASHDYDEDHLIREPNAPDPEQGDFTLEEAVVGLPVDGSLVAEIGTEFGTLLCDLHARRAPRTVANFVGLARGLRPWWDARAGEWVTNHHDYYRGLTFHRVIPEYLIQGGDYLGDGTGTVGYTIPDERDDSLVHDRAGQLCMANHDGANSAGAQFFITDGPAPQLDHEPGYTIFGQCMPTHVVSEIARVPQNADQGNRPLTPVHITRLLIRRVEGGAANAEPTRPRLPPGEPEQPRQASPDPFHQRGYPSPSPLPGGRHGPPSHRQPLPQQQH